MAGFQDKASGHLDGVTAGVEHVGADVGDGAAAVAQQVQVGIAGEVIDRSTVPEMHVLDQPELREGVERSVDRRLVHRWVDAGDPFGQIVGSGMIVRRHQRLDHGTTRAGHTPAGVAEAEKDVVDGLNHAGTL